MIGSPLAQTNESTMNEQRPSSQVLSEYEVKSYTTTTAPTSTTSDSPPSSPFVANVPEDASSEYRPLSLQARRTSGEIENNVVSPLKMFKSRASPNLSQSPQKGFEPLRSPRKISSPEKRFPVKPSSPEKRPVVEERTVSIDDVLRDNGGLTKAIAILEDEDSYFHQEGDDTLTSLEASAHGEAQNIDDTMVSTFSEFSAVPADLTSFARLGQTPSKFPQLGPTPRRTQAMTPATARRPTEEPPSSPTPRGQRFSREEGDTTNLILDFTDQINGFSGRRDPLSPTKQARTPYKSATVDMTRFGTNTPASNRMSNLLDFDIPPAPTPRSMPSITPRELETLKSSFLSEISSLKASLSGKEAEVQSLKTAVGDAEKRVGESMEQVREERSVKEQLAAEKEQWEKRGREMEDVLRNVKDEIMHGERERDELEGRLMETEGRREAAEMMAQEAQSKMAAMRAGKLSPTIENTETKPGECSCGGSKAIEIAVEKVSRELHTLYKEKHETKVSALKKSYERRWDKKVKELEAQVEDLSKENEELKLGRNTTMTQIEARSVQEINADLEQQAAKDAKTKELEAELDGLSHVIKSIKKDNSDLHQLLEEERVEKGKLVQAVDEMIPLVAAFDEMLENMNSAPPPPVADTTPRAKTRPVSMIEPPRGSVSRISGLRAPATTSSIPTGQSRIGRGNFGGPAPRELERSGSAQAVRPGSGLGYRSHIMSNIEKMGSYKGRAD